MRRLLNAKLNFQLTQPFRKEDGNVEPLLEVIEDMGNVWTRADFGIPVQDQKYRVVFSAQYDNSDPIPEGDIAIDDVSFTPSCRFIDEPMTTTQRPCPDNQFACADGKTCINKVNKVFVFICKTVKF